MTDSLIEKLNKEKPNRQQIFNLLGKPKLEGRVADNEVDYFLKSEDFFTVWILAVNFDDVEILNLQKFCAKISLGEKHEVFCR